jgi:hypothetical protein
MNTTHIQVAEGIRRTVETVILGDWRQLSEEQLVQAAARLRTIKARYVQTRLTHPDGQHDVLSFLDQALIALYLVLDTLQGRDPTKQRAIYHALVEAQSPLLLAHSMIPIDEPAGEERLTIVVPETHHSIIAPVNDAAEEQGKAERFLWTEERLSLLQQALATGEPQETVAATIAAIAQRYQWPRSAVRYKVYALLRARNAGRESQTDEMPSQEEDRRGETEDERGE